MPLPHATFDAGQKRSGAPDSAVDGEAQAEDAACLGIMGAARAATSNCISPRIPYDDRGAQSHSCTVRQGRKLVEVRYQQQLRPRSGPAAKPPCAGTLNTADDKG